MLAVSIFVVLNIYYMITSVTLRNYQKRYFQIQGFKLYKGKVQSRRRILQISRRMLQAYCGNLQSYREVLQPTTGILQVYCGAVIRLWVPL